MGKFKTGDKVFYVHNSYGELPEIRHGVVVDPPPGMEDSVFCSVRPIEHRDSFLTTTLQKGNEVFLTEADTYPLLESVIKGRILDQRQEIDALTTCLRDAASKVGKAVPIDLDNESPLRRLRKSKGLNDVGAMALVLNTSRTTMANIESGFFKMSASMKRALAELGFNAEEIEQEHNTFMDKVKVEAERKFREIKGDMDDVP